jgi:hypothetical protein
MSKDKTTLIKSKIKRLYKIVTELEKDFPKRKFTLDGHLVGSIGDVVVAEYYNLKLASQTQKGYDATTNRGRKVEIKATQKKSIGLRSVPAHLIVIKLDKNGGWKEIYNGPGKFAWENAGKKQKNGQKNISLSKLTKLMMTTVNPKDKIPQIRNL